MKPWLHRQWCIPPRANAAFVCAMEDVLSLYKRDVDPDQPLVCMDEISKQLVTEVRQPLMAHPGSPVRYDYEYERNGVCNMFMFYEPFAGKRHVSVTDRRTKVDWAMQIRELLDVRYPNVEKVTLVLDNLNTHTGASLYDGVRPPGSTATAGQTRYPLHPQTWQLAQYCRDRIGCSRTPVPGPTHPRQADSGTRGRRMGTATQCDRGQG